jgi:hypothetical protein
MERAITRQDVLQGGLTARLGCSTLTRMETTMPPRTAAAPV